MSVSLLFLTRPEKSSAATSANQVATQFVVKRSTFFELNHVVFYAKNEIIAHQFQEKENIVLGALG